MYYMIFVLLARLHVGSKCLACWCELCQSFCHGAHGTEDLWTANIHEEFLLPGSSSILPPPGFLLLDSPIAYQWSEASRTKEAPRGWKRHCSHLEAVITRSCPSWDGCKLRECEAWMATSPASWSQPDTPRLPKCVDHFRRNRQLALQLRSQQVDSSAPRSAARTMLGPCWKKCIDGSVCWCYEGSLG